MENNYLKEKIRKSVKEKIAISNIRKEVKMKNDKILKITSMSAVAIVFGFAIIFGINTLNNNVGGNNIGIANLKENKEESIKIEININKLETVSEMRIDAKVEDANSLDMQYFEILKNIKVPNNMGKMGAEKIYVRDLNTGEYTKLHSYVCTYLDINDNMRNIRISFSDTNKPLRDYHFEDIGNISKINDIELKIYQYEEAYITIFEFGGYKFDIETSNVTEEEILEVLKSIILVNESTTKKVVIEDKDTNQKEETNQINTYKDYYAGKYVDSNGNNVILLCIDNEENRKEICKILGITESKTIFESAKYSYNYLVNLQDKISKKMQSKELEFVTTSSLMEDSNIIKVNVITNNENDLRKVKELDIIGGAIKIEYSSNLQAKEDLLEIKE